jgi:hypothetical protein
MCYGTVLKCSASNFFEWTFFATFAKFEAKCTDAKARNKVFQNLINKIIIPFPGLGYQIVQIIVAGRRGRFIWKHMGHGFYCLNRKCIRCKFNERKLFEEEEYMAV